MRRNLPHELHSLIIGEVEGTYDLLALALTCSDFRDQAQRRLFYYPQPFSSGLQQKLFLSIISSPGRVGLMVRIYQHRFPDSQDSGTAAQFATALRAMCGLQQLSLLLWPPLLPVTVFDGCTFKLSVFEFLLPKPEAEYITYHFLPTQDDLRHLTVYESREDFTRPRPTVPHVAAPSVSGSLSICPHLESLAAGGDWLDFFLRGDRPIRALKCMNVKVVSARTQQLARLKYLKTLSSSQYSTDPATTKKLQSLSTLEIQETVILGQPGLNEKFRFLEVIPRLRTLILCGPSYKLNYDGFVRNVFGLCPTLERIDIVCGRPVGESACDRYLAPRDVGEIRHKPVAYDSVYSGWEIGPFHSMGMGLGLP